MPGAMENERQTIELSGIFRVCAEGFLQKHRLCPEQMKAFKAIMECRTFALGGHIKQCDSCGHIEQSYNSCRNRHCPKCQFIKKEKWVDKLAGNLPPTRCFHIVFTIPEGLNKLFYLNQAKAYNLLFKAAGNTVVKVAANPKFLGAQAGAVGILHTWGQTLTYHPHIHMVVPAGGLSPDGCEWVHSGKRFFLPVKVMGKIFRGILCRFLEESFEQSELILPDDAQGFKPVKEICYRKNWVVYCEKPFNDSGALIGYLGNYTHRVAISNHRLKAFADGMVTFVYKDYGSGGLQRTMRLDADEFIRRFMQHVLPKGFYKIRYFGFMAMCNRQSKLPRCFDLIGEPSFLPRFEGLQAYEVYERLTGKDIFRCPKCHSGLMTTVFKIKGKPPLAS
jgi:hypothetical protein